jgi:hypothetical protein
MTPDSLRWLLDHTAATYRTENQEVERVKDRAALILSVVVAPLIAAFVYLVAGMKNEPFSQANLIYFWGPACLACVLLLAAIAFVGYVMLRGFYYSKAPRPLGIVQFFANHPTPDEALAEAQEALIAEYSACIEENFEKTERRKRALLAAQRLALLALLFLALSLPRWLYSNNLAPPEPQAVRIVSPVQIAKEQAMTTPTPPAPAPAPAPATPPASQPTTTSQNAKPVFPKRTMVLDSITQTPKPGARVLTETNKKP